jgi:peptidyl-prolyl cis-trans isomerase SurA
MALSSGTAWAAEVTIDAAQPMSTAQSAQFVDGIAAVVNKQVITLRQLEAETRTAEQQLQKQKIPVPDRSILQKQVLQRMIAEELERQEAERLGITVSDAQVEQAVRSIAQRNKITPQRLRQEIEGSGVPWELYLKGLHQEVRLDMLRQRAVDSTIVISDADVDAFLKNEGQQLFGRQGAAPGVAAPGQQPAQAAPAQSGAQQSAPAALGLAQILVAIPEGASSATVQELKGKAESIRAQLRSGADFAGVAAASSDDPQALRGGDMGVRPVAGWPDLFIQKTQNLKVGEISDVFQSGNGFHILKVLTRGQAPQQPPGGSGQIARQGPAAQAQGPMIVTQTRARHILIKTSKIATDEQAKTRLEQLRQRLVHGESFEDLAKRYSEDVSAPQGGDLGWLTPGETVPAFEQAMNTLQPGEISEPVRSQFGWHLIRVEERRNKNMEEEFKRMQARQVLFQRRVEPAFEDWLNRLRGEAYIDNRLDPQAKASRR